MPRNFIVMFLSESEINSFPCSSLMENGGSEFSSEDCREFAVGNESVLCEEDVEKSDDLLVSKYDEMQSGHIKIKWPKLNRAGKPLKGEFDVCTVKILKCSDSVNDLKKIIVKLQKGNFEDLAVDAEDVNSKRKKTANKKYGSDTDSDDVTEASKSKKKAKTVSPRKLAASEALKDVKKRIEEKKKVVDTKLAKGKEKKTKVIAIESDDNESVYSGDNESEESGTSGKTMKKEKKVEKKAVEGKLYTELDLERARNKALKEAFDKYLASKQSMASPSDENGAGPSSRSQQPANVRIGGTNIEVNAVSYSNLNKSRPAGYTGELVALILGDRLARSSLTGKPSPATKTNHSKEAIDQEVVNAIVADVQGHFHDFTISNIRQAIRGKCNNASFAHRKE